MGVPAITRAVFVSVLSIAAVGCGGAPSAAPPLVFDTAAFQTLTSTSGQLRIEVRWSPPMPVRGQDAAEIRLLDRGGNAVDDLSLAVLPWMPAHGHGTSVQPTIMEAARGVAIASPVFLYMSGLWQLRLTVSGALDDTAVADVQIP